MAQLSDEVKRLQDLEDSAVKMANEQKFNLEDEMILLILLEIRSSLIFDHH